MCAFKKSYLYIERTSQFMTKNAIIDYDATRKVFVYITGEYDGTTEHTWGEALSRCQTVSTYNRR